MAALDARVRVTGPDGERVIALADFHRLPGSTPHIDTNLKPHELITAVELPAKGFAEHNAYVKLRDRASYAFALVSVAAALELGGADNSIPDARIALGGVAHKPWRDVEAEVMLRGLKPTADTFREVAQFILRDAKGFGHNDFKIELARRAIQRTLGDATWGASQPASRAAAGT